MSEKILVVEDDNDINQLITTILKKEGYETASAFSGTEAELRLKLEEYDLLILDLMLPGMSGEEVITKIRADKKLPIIVMTAKGGLEDKVNVLGLGADDYVTKPFETPELLARVKAQLRRANEFAGVTKMNSEPEKKILKVGELELNPETMVFQVGHQPVELTASEFKILQCMMSNPKRVFSKEGLYEAVWENGYYGEDNTVSVHVSNLRKKIAAITNKDYIKTVWGIGYKLED